MDDLFNITETHTVTRADGTPFARLTVEYFAVPRAQVMRAEQEVVATLAARLKWGEESAALHAQG